MLGEHRTFTPFTLPPPKNKNKKAFSSPQAGEDSAVTPAQPHREAGTPRTLDAKASAAQRRGSENSLSLFTSACFHVPPVALHFEPVSNGGPRTDFPAEECVLRLIHRTASQLSPSGTRGKDGAAGASRAGCSCTSARVRGSLGEASALLPDRPAGPVWKQQKQT